MYCLTVHSLAPSHWLVSSPLLAAELLARKKASRKKAGLNACVQETALGQRFEVDATLYCNLLSAGCEDDLHATTDYAEVHRYSKGFSQC